jgi:integrase
MAKERGVYEYPKGSDIWWCQYFDHGVRKRERAGTKTNAGKLYRKRRTQLLAGDKLPELRRKKVTVGDLADLALAYAKVHNKSVRDYVTKAALIKAGLGARIADEIGPDEISDWIQSRKVSDGTFNRYRAFISLAYKEGMRLGKVKTNTARLIHQRQESKGRKRFLSRSEYADLYAAIEDLSHKEELAVSVLSGMRLTEQFTCEWQQVDFERSEIGLTKTKNGEDRTVTMNSEVREILWARKERVKPKRKDVVFPGNTSGGRVDTRTWFNPALKEAEIEDYVWHCNRHTFCSWLAIAGVPLKTIMELAGHKTIAITAQYAHLCPDHKATEVEKILTAPTPRNVVPFAGRATQTAIGDSKKIGKVG